MTTIEELKDMTEEDVRTFVIDPSLKRKRVVGTERIQKQSTGSQMDAS